MNPTMRTRTLASTWGHSLKSSQMRIHAKASSIVCDAAEALWLQLSLKEFAEHKEGIGPRTKKTKKRQLAKKLADSK